MPAVEAVRRLANTADLDPEGRARQPQEEGARSQPSQEDEPRDGKPGEGAHPPLEDQLRQAVPLSLDTMQDI